MDDILSELDRLGVEYQELEKWTKEYSKLCVIRREFEEDPILLLGTSTTGWVGLRSPRKGEDDGPMREFRRLEKQKKVPRRRYFVL